MLENKIIQHNKAVPYRLYGGESEENMTDKTYNITELIEYMKICVMNTRGKEQLKCLRILEILEEKEKDENDRL